MYTKIKNITLILLLFLPPPVFSEENAGRDSADLVSVTIDFKGLDESAVILKEATETLSLSLKNAAKSPEKLSVEQMQELGKLIDKSENLVASLNQTLNGINPAISNAKQPTNDLLSSLLKTAQSNTIDPTIESINNKVKVWIVLILIGAILIILLVGAWIFYSTRQLREVAQIIKSLGEEYEIIRRQKE